MPSYPGLTRVPAGPEHDVLKTLFDLVQGLQTRLGLLESTTLQQGGTIQAGGQRIAGLADPQDDQDAVTKRYLRGFVQAQAKVISP